MVQGTLQGTEGRLGSWLMHKHTHHSSELDVKTLGEGKGGFGFPVERKQRTEMMAGLRQAIR